MFVQTQLVLVLSEAITPHAVFAQIQVKQYEILAPTQPEAEVTHSPQETILLEAHRAEVILHQREAVVPVL